MRRRRSTALRLPASAAKRIRQREIKKEDAIEKKLKKVYWKPEFLNQRFPTETDILLGNMEGNYSSIYSDPIKLQKAERWRLNYAKSLQTMIMNAQDTDVSAEIQDALDQLYWEILNMPEHKFIEGMSRFEGEVGIRMNYRLVDLEANAQRVIERWSEIM